MQQDSNENIIWTPLDNILAELKHNIVNQNVFADTFLKNKDAFHDIANKSSVMVTLHDMEAYKPLYLNDKCKNFYGFKENWMRGVDYIYYLQTVHPSNFYTLIEAVNFFLEKREGHMHLTYRLKHHSGKWRVVYGVSTAIHETKKGVNKFVLTISQEQEQIKGISYTEDDKEIEEKITLLSKNEKGLLKLLAMDLPTKEIASKLFLSEHTILSYRKKLIKKLEVNSSLGLVKYGLWLLKNDIS